MKLKLLLIKVQEKPDVRIVNIEHSLQTFYETLGCDTIDMVIREVCGKNHYFIIDDEGLLVDDPIPSVVTRIDGQTVVEIAGNILIGNVEYNDEEGCYELVSLQDEDIEAITERILTLRSKSDSRSTPQSTPVLVLN